MPDIKAIDDISTYRAMADKAYAKKATNAVVNPKRVIAQREEEAESGAPEIPPAAQIPGVTFTKGFTPAEKAAQKTALLKKLQELDSEEKK